MEKLKEEIKTMIESIHNMFVLEQIKLVIMNLLK